MRGGIHATRDEGSAAFTARPATEMRPSAFLCHVGLKGKMSAGLCRSLVSKEASRGAPGNY